MTVLTDAPTIKTGLRAGSILIADPHLAAQIRAERERSDSSRHDEVWDGVYVVSPSPNTEHQYLASELWLILRSAVGRGGRAFIDLNISDREEGWVQNFRIPDANVFLEGNPAKDRGTHWCGGPDFAIEILSTGDVAREKLPFYAGVGVRELLIVDRNPWALELYRLDAGRLTLAGRSSLENPDVLTSAVLPLAFRLLPGEDRPQIEATRNDGAERWLV